MTSSFSVGDKVLLTKPQQPFPSHWPATTNGMFQPARSSGTSAYWIGTCFGLLESIWDKYKDQIYIITELRSYQKCPAVVIKNSDGSHSCGYSWPVECFSLANATPAKESSSQILCDCPLNVILARGCQKKDHC